MFGRYLSSAICLRLRWKPNWDNPKKCMECWPQSSFALIVFCLSHRNYEVVPSFSLPSLDASSFFWFVLIYIKVCSNPNQCYKLALPVMLAGLYTPSTIVTFLMYFWKKNRNIWGLHLVCTPKISLNHHWIPSIHHFFIAQKPGGTWINTSRTQSIPVRRPTRCSSAGFSVLFLGDFTNRPGNQVVAVLVDLK